MFSQVVPWQRVKVFLNHNRIYFHLFCKRLQADVLIVLVLFFFEMLHHHPRVVVAVVSKKLQILFE
jgi:hypothetical protein